MKQTETQNRMNKVLIVDDEEVICRSVNKVLMRMGYETDWALSANSALKKMERSNTFDMIITDLMMPDVTGMELLKMVNDRWPETLVLIITGYASIRAAVDAAQQGASGFVPKPFTREELEKAVENAFQKSRQATHKRFGSTDGLQDPADKKERNIQNPISDSIEVGKSFNAGSIPTASSYGILMGPSDIPIASRLDTETMQADTPSGAIHVDKPFNAGSVPTASSYSLLMGPSDIPIVGHWDTGPVEADSPRILVVDDEPVVVNSILKTLKRKGYVMDEVFTGCDAIERIKTQPYDLVILDMKLPDVNGLDLLPKIKHLCPSLPVVIVTGYASIDTAIRSIERGADDYMAKPFTPGEMISMTDRIFERNAA